MPRGNEYTLDCSLAKETRARLDPFTFAYIETAMWTLTHVDGDSLDYLGLWDIAPETIDKAIADCREFQDAHGQLFIGRESQAGHDLWLTRNRHGAGFWDGDWPESTASILTAAAHAQGEVDWYVGDDEAVYQYQE